jgi:hypothetical protein
MKHFIFTKESGKTGRNGGRKLSFNIYEVVDNEVVPCGGW